MQNGSKNLAQGLNESLDWVPRKLCIHQDTLESCLTKHVMENTPGAEIKIIETTPRFETGAGDPETIYLVPQKSRFLKNCPGTHNYYLCCGYKILDLVHNCIYRCSYCVLRSYFQGRSLVAFTNVEDSLKELKTMFNKYPGKVFRIGTGEFTDSLALESILGHAGTLVPFFSTFKNAVLELKTKSINVDVLANLQHNGRTIVSWSLNPDLVIEKLEPGTPSLDQRLETAAKCVSWGYKVGFHFDPIIFVPGWKKHYETAIKKLFNYVNPGNVAWISMGVLRFPPSMKKNFIKLEDEMFFNWVETIRGIDGKTRYLKPIRINMLKTIREYLVKHGNNELVTYLCMESREVWEQVYPDDPSYHGKFRKLLDQQAVETRVI